MSKTTLHIIADDLTGAADTGIQFAKRGLYTILIPFHMEAVRDLHAAQVIALNTDTRRMPSERAYERVKETASLLKDRNSIYKKIDSTLRGNVGAEIEAVMDAAGIGFAILAPAFPTYGRTTVNGVHLVNGQPLSRTEAASDPVSPVSESHIPTLIRGQTRLKIGQIGLKELHREQIPLKQTISQHVDNGERIIVFDAVTDDDLSIIAETAMSISPPPLMVGSAGLADQVSRILRQREHRPITRKTKSDGAIIVVSGSLSAVTSKQLDAIGEAGKGEIIYVDAGELIESRTADSKREDEIVSKVISVMSSTRVAGIRSAGTCRTAPAYANEADLPRLIVDCLGRLTLQIVRRCPQPISGLILTGGDMALAAFRHLGISGVRLVDEILPGIPCGEVIDGEFGGLTVVTKAGAFGDESALIKCIDFLYG